MPFHKSKGFYSSENQHETAYEEVLGMEIINYDYSVQHSFSLVYKIDTIMRIIEVYVNLPAVISTLLSYVLDHDNIVDHCIMRVDFLLFIEKVRYYRVRVFDIIILVLTENFMDTIKVLVNLKQILRNVYLEKLENVYEEVEENKDKKLPMLKVAV